MMSLLKRDRLPIVAWLTMTTLLLTLQHVSNRVLRDPGYQFTRWQGLHNYLDGWSQFDGPEYIKIVKFGYWYTPGVRSPIVWFPLYPSIVRWFTAVISDPMLAGIAVSSIAGITATVVFWHWLAAKGIDGRSKVVALAVLMLYPYGWYLYGVVHSDSLFLALVVGAFLLVEKDRLVLAGLIGALASATRPTGIAVIPSLILAGLLHDGVLTVPPAATGFVQRFAIPIRFDRSRIRAATFGPVLSAGGLGAYMIYLGVRFGDPIAFINNQRVYHPGNLPLLKRAFFVVWRDAEDWRMPLTLTGQAILVAITIVSVPFVARRFGWGYAAFIGILVAIPTFSTEDFMGTGRYLMAAFPVMALIGETIAPRPAIRRTVLGFCAVAMIGMSMGFARSWYLT